MSAFKLPSIELEQAVDYVEKLGIKKAEAEKNLYRLTEEKKVNAKKLLNSKFDESKNLYEYLEILNK